MLVGALFFSCSSYSSSGVGMGNSIITMLSGAACNVIKKRGIGYGRGYTIKVTAEYHSGKVLSTTSFGGDKDHAVAKFLCENNTSEVKILKYHKVK